MDIRKFGPASPGEVVSILDNKHAFVPNALPPAWEFPPDYWPLVVEAKQLIGILEGLGRNLPNPGILLRPMAEREAISSSSLEGTYATPKELLLFAINPKESKSADDPANDWREVFNYKLALEHSIESDLPLSFRLVRELHQILLQGVRGRDRAPGEFRRIQVAIGSSERFIPPPPERLKECLTSLEKYFHVESSPYDPLVNSYLAHYQFEAIHPFVDGNGRVGRLLLAMMLQTGCKLTKPWLYMSEFFDRNRDEYLELLFNVSSRGDWNSWIEFCLKGTVEQASATIDRCEKLLSLREEYRERLVSAGGHMRLNTIISHIFDIGFVRISEMARQCDVTYQTATSDINRLVQAGLLEELENTYPKAFYAPEVFRIT